MTWPELSENLAKASLAIEGSQPEKQTQIKLCLFFLKKLKENCAQKCNERCEFKRNLDDFPKLKIMILHIENPCAQKPLSHSGHP